MALLEALSSTELLNFIIYDTIFAPNTNTTPNPHTTTNSIISNNSSSSSHESNSVENSNFLLLGHCHSIMKPPQYQNCPPSTPQLQEAEAEAATTTNKSISSCLGLGAMEVVEGGRSHSKKRRKRPRACKNKEEAETQRMTHITVERNRRKQMNEHLAVLRALMPHSYVQRGDQASIVGGAIEFVKELEHLLQSLEAQKLQLLQQQVQRGRDEANVDGNEETAASAAAATLLQPPFAQFFMYPQYTWSQCPNKFTSKSKAAIADIEVTLIETHASLRILSRKCLRQLSKLVAAFHSLHLTILHLTVTTLHPLVLYSISAKVEEGCQLSSVDDIAAAVHHMLRIIEEEAAFSC